MSVKKDILAWINNKCPVQQGICLYEKYGKNTHFLRLVKIAPESYAPDLEYQLCQIAGIPEEKLPRMKKKLKKKQAKAKKKPKKKLPKAKIIKKTVADKHQAFVKRFRDEFPFLKDSSCPDELKILAADKITAYHAYVNAHKKLFDCSSNDECLNVARDVVENYLENQQIYEELNYYKEHSHVLGKHQIFKRRTHLQKLAQLTPFEQTQLYIKRIPHRIWRIKDEIKRGDSPHLLIARQERIKEYEYQLAELKRLLNVK